MKKRNKKKKKKEEEIELDSLEITTNGKTLYGFTEFILSSFIDDRMSIIRVEATRTSTSTRTTTLSLDPWCTIEIHFTTDFASIRALGQFFFAVLENKEK